MYPFKNLTKKIYFYVLLKKDKWEEAVEVAEAEDRIGAKAALHSWARHLEACGDTLAATRLYERAGTHRTHVKNFIYLYI